MTDAELIAYNWGLNHPGQCAGPGSTTRDTATNAEQDEIARARVAVSRLGLDTFRGWAQRGAAFAGTRDG